jgi:hypothetical protein
MRVKSRLSEIASVGLLVAFASTAALAQGAAGGAGSTPEGQSATGVRPNVGSAAAPTTAPTAKAESSRESASAGPWTADNVTADRPFGAISTDAAGTTPESMRTWAQTRTESERTELSGRCAVITSSANSSKYPSQAQEFCRDYMMVANVPTPSNPSGVPGATSTGQSGGQKGVEPKQ